MAKTKGAKGGNPTPVQTEAFKSQIKPSAADVDEPLAKKPLAVKLPASHDAIVRAMDNKQAFVRAAVREKLERDGWISRRYP
ncbi:MAG: hypothetical protein IGR80_13950 [Synechococcales cyanobacterium K44_A2020_017]|nr:hypothetical protein [Synechococcales cyanobacterium K32_A2020_035]MBF2095847.1 hypothetical protein [Synechococcales cyanobacterium K44_A2020_017]